MARLVSLTGASCPGKVPQFANKVVFGSLSGRQHANRDQSFVSRALTNRREGAIERGCARIVETIAQNMLDRFTL